MKKLFIIICLILCISLLCACGKSDAPEHTEPPLPPELVLEPMDDSASIAMANFSLANRALVKDEILYCFEFDSAYNSVLASYSLHGGTLSDFVILAENCSPEYLSEHGGRLYYINTAQGNIIESIALDGQDRQILREAHSSFLQISGSKLFYCNEESALCSADLDGGNEFVLLAEPCYYPYVIGELLIYQSDSRGEKLYLRSLSSGTEMQLTRHASYLPLVVGSRLFYSSQNGIHSLDLDGQDDVLHAFPAFSSAEFFYHKGAFYLRGVSQGDIISQWCAELSDEENANPQSHTGYRLCDYTSRDYRIDTQYNLDGRIRYFVLTNAEGEELYYIAGEEAD